MHKARSSLSTRNLALDSLLQKLEGVVHPSILAAPHLDWKEVLPKFTAHLLRAVAGEPWMNHLAFMVVVLTAHTKLGRASICGQMYNLPARVRMIFPAYQLTSSRYWNRVEHIPPHLN